MRQLIKSILREFANDKLKNSFDDLIKKGNFQTALNLVGNNPQILINIVRYTKSDFELLIRKGELNTALILAGNNPVNLMKIMDFKEKDLEFMVKNFGIPPTIQYFGGIQKFAQTFYGDESKILFRLSSDAKITTTLLGGPKNLLKVLKIPLKSASISNNLVLSVNGAPFTLFNEKKSKYVLVTKNYDFGTWTSLNNYFYEDGIKYFWNLNNLSNLEITKGNFGLYDINLENFNGLSKHNGNFTIAHNTVINNWDTLQIIKGNFTVYDSATIHSLGSLNKVGGKVDIRGNVQDLGNLKIVGDDFILTNQNLLSLGQLQKVGGRLRIRNSNLQDLGTLSHVGDRVLVNKNTNSNIIDQCRERGFKISKG